MKEYVSCKRYCFCKFQMQAQLIKAHVPMRIISAQLGEIQVQATPFAFLFLFRFWSIASLSPVLTSCESEANLFASHLEILCYRLLHNQHSLRIRSHRKTTLDSKLTSSILQSKSWLRHFWSQFSGAIALHLFGHVRVKLGA